MELFCANSQEVLLELEAAIEEHSLYDVLRCFCEATNHGMDLTDPLPSSVRNFNFIAAHCGKRLIFDHLFLRIFFRFFVSKIFFYDFQTKKPERKRNTPSVLSLFTGAIKKKDKHGRKISINSIDSNISHVSKKTHKRNYSIDSVFSNTSMVYQVKLLLTYIALKL